MTTPTIDRQDNRDFRDPIHPDDRVLALRTLMEAKGDAIPKPPVCHGYINGCTCPPCKLRASRGRRRALAA